MLKIPSLAKSGPFADKYEEEAFWQLHTKQGGGYINRTAIRELALKLKSSGVKVSEPPLIVPKIALPSIALPSIHVPKL